LPEEHGALKHKVPTSGDYNPGQADVPRAFREYDDSVTADFQEVQAELDSAKQAGGVAGHVFASEVSRSSTTLGSFSTPVKVTLPKVKARQIIEVVCAFAVLHVSSGLPAVHLWVNGDDVYNPYTGEGEGSSIAFGNPTAGKYRVYRSNDRQPFTEEEREGSPSDPAGVGHLAVARMRPIFLDGPSEDATNLPIELVGSNSASGVPIKLAYPRLYARVWG
jgi:hypothetical protein